MLLGDFVGDLYLATVDPGREKSVLIQLETPPAPVFMSRSQSMNDWHWDCTSKSGEVWWQECARAHSGPQAQLNGESPNVPRSSALLGPPSHAISSYLAKARQSHHHSHVHLQGDSFLFEKSSAIQL